MLLILVYFIYTPLFAQTTVHGTVTDSMTGTPLGGVIISGVNNGSVHTTTDGTGTFRLQTNTPLDSIRVSHTGYRSQKLPVSPGGMHISLHPMADLGEVIVSASRELQPRSEAPIAIQAISRATINETKATRLDMLINKVPGVFMVDLGNEQHSMAMRQPLGYNNLFLYLEDGVPIRTTGDFNHNALIEINQAAVDRIEVIKGPASSIYGSEAVGGAINFITPSPSPLPSAKLQAEAGSFGYKRAEFSASSSFKKLGLYTGGYFADQNQDENLHNNFRKAAITLRADYQFNNRTKLLLTGAYINYKTDQKGGIDSVRFYNKDYTSRYRFTYRKVEAFRLKASLSHQWNDNNHTNFILFHRNTSIGQNPFYSIGSIAGNPLKATGQINEDAFTSYGAIIQHSKKFGFLNAKWITGLSADFSPATYNARYIDVDVNSDKIYYDYTPTDSVLTDYKVDLLNTAAYTQFEINPAKRLKLVAAARYDRMDYRFDNHLPPGAYSGAPDASNHFDYFTPKLGLTYAFTQRNGIYLNYSVGFAPPNITDLYTGVQVPVLKPSSYNNYEIGGWLGFADGKGNVEVSLYQLDGSNEIISVKLANGTYQNQNAGQTRHKGIELGIRYAFNKEIYLRAGGTYAEHRYLDYIQQGDNYSGNYMGQAPPYMINSEISYKPSFLSGFRVALEWQSLGSYFMDPANTQKYNGFNVFNARMGYRFQSVECWVNCLNLANAVYATTVEKSAYGTQYRPGQLRTFNAGVAYYFYKKNNDEK